MYEMEMEMEMDPVQSSGQRAAGSGQQRSDELAAPAVFPTTDTNQRQNSLLLCVGLLVDFAAVEL